MLRLYAHRRTRRDSEILHFVYMDEQMEEYGLSESMTEKIIDLSVEFEEEVKVCVVPSP